jgi:hypothetical protein
MEIVYRVNIKILTAKNNQIRLLQYHGNFAQHPYDY